MIRRLIFFIIISCLLQSTSGFAQDTVLIFKCLNNLEDNYLKARSDGAVLYHWYKNETLIQSGSSAKLPLSGEGDYTVVAENAAGCKTSSIAILRFSYERPKAKNDTFYIVYNKSKLLDVLGNDYSICAPIDRKTLKIIDRPYYGHAEIAKNGFINYKSSGILNDNLFDSFTYVYRDQTATQSDTATVYLNIQGICANVYPNPFENVVQVNIIDSNVKKIVIVDLLGRFVLVEAVTHRQLEINLSSLSAGHYFIQLFDKNNILLCTRRVTKVG